jgi:hypothetical protein
MSTPKVNSKIPKMIEPTEYDKRVKAISLAIQHSKSCHSETLIKLAERIYNFISSDGKHKKSAAPSYA